MKMFWNKCINRIKESYLSVHQYGRVSIQRGHSFNSGMTSGAPVMTAKVCRGSAGLEREPGCRQCWAAA